MVNRYRSGRIHEKKVVNDLSEKVFENIRRSAGSRGAADVYATKNGQKYYIQVKSGGATKEDIGDSLAIGGNTCQIQK